MKKSALNFDNLLPACHQLEASLFYWRYSAPGIWPVDELEDVDLKAFVAAIYELAHTGISMAMPVNAPDRLPYLFRETGWLEKREFIALTRELLWCCNLDLVSEYRQPEWREYEAVRLLEQTHAQLIGAVYARYSGEETVSATDIRFAG